MFQPTYKKREKYQLFITQNFEVRLNFGLRGPSDGVIIPASWPRRRRYY